MTKMNAVGWFDIYVNELDRAVKFYETVLATKLEPIGDPTGENQMMSFPADMSAYGAGGALTKSPHASPGSVVLFCIFRQKTVPLKKHALQKPEAKSSDQNSQLENLAG